MPQINPDQTWTHLASNKKTKHTLVAHGGAADALLAVNQSVRRLLPASVVVLDECGGSPVSALAVATARTVTHTTSASVDLRIAHAFDGRVVARAAIKGAIATAAA